MSTPARISASGLGQVLQRCCVRVFEQRLLGEAAAVAFYALLAVFPTLAALISLCGLAIDPAAERFQGPVWKLGRAIQFCRSGLGVSGGGLTGSVAKCAFGPKTQHLLL